MFKFLSSVDWTQVATALGAVVAAITGLVRSFKGANKKDVKDIKNKLPFIVLLLLTISTSAQVTFNPPDTWMQRYHKRTSAHDTVNVLSNGQTNIQLYIDSINHNDTVWIKFDSSNLYSLLQQFKVTIACYDSSSSGTVAKANFIGVTSAPNYSSAFAITSTLYNSSYFSIGSATKYVISRFSLESDGTYWHFLSTNQPYVKTP